MFVYKSLIFTVSNQNTVTSPPPHTHTLQFCYFIPLLDSFVIVSSWVSLTLLSFKNSVYSKIHSLWCALLWALTSAWRWVSPPQDQTEGFYHLRNSLVLFFCSQPLCTPAPDNYWSVFHPCDSRKSYKWSCITHNLLGLVSFIEQMHLRFIHVHVWLNSLFLFPSM